MPERPSLGVMADLYFGEFEVELRSLVLALAGAATNGLVL